jgi:hypothetical protein
MAVLGVGCGGADKTTSDPAAPAVPPFQAQPSVPRGIEGALGPKITKVTSVRCRTGREIWSGTERGSNAMALPKKQCLVGLQGGHPLRFVQFASGWLQLSHELAF